MYVTLGPSSRTPQYTIRRELIQVQFPYSRVKWLILVAFLLLVLLGCLHQLKTNFAVVVPNDPSSSKALTRMLTGWKHSAAQYSSLDESLRSNADVLVLWLPSQDTTSVDEATLNQLRKRRVVAVGSGSAELFGRLGLEINEGACAHDPDDRSPEIRLEKNSLVAKEPTGRKLTAFVLPGKADENTDYNFAMYIPAKSHLRSVVEVIGIYPGDRQAFLKNYAPIVRQGNYLMVGFAAPVETWTPEYKKLFRELATSLLQRKPQPFPSVNWCKTRAERYYFRLAKFGSTTDLPDQTFYFRFTEPTTFTAKLDTTGSSEVMLLFTGKYKEHWSRKDAGLNEGTHIEVQISNKDVRSSGEGHWRLRVTNFDAEHEAECALTITY